MKLIEEKDTEKKASEVKSKEDVENSNTCINVIKKSISTTPRFPGISEVLPYLYICGAGIAIPSTLDQIQINFIINAAPELPDTPLSDSKPLYLRVNVLDNGDADLKSYFHEISDLIEEVHQSNGKTLVHCVAGVSRSASLCIAYLIKYKDMTLKEAYHHLKNARPQICPNFGFFRQLMSYEEEIRGCTSTVMIFCESIGKEIPDVYEPEYRAMEEYYKKRRKNFKTHQILT